MAGESSIWRLVMLCIVVVITASACTGSDDAQPEVVSSAVEADSEPESPTTSDTTTTTEAPSTTEALSEDEAAVLEAVRRFFEELPDRPDKTKTPDQYPDVLDEYITDPLLTRIREDDAKDSAAGITVESYPSLYFIESVEIDTTGARVATCDLARDATFTADGALLTPSAGLFTNSELSLDLGDDNDWRVQEWLKPTDDSRVCDPVLLWTGGEPGDPSTHGELRDVGDRDEIMNVVGRLDEYLEIAGRFDERKQSRADVEPLYGSVAIRHELYFMSKFLEVQENDAEADTVLNGWEYRVASVRVTEPTAQLLVCAAPNLKFLSADDGSFLGADRTPIWSIAFMHQDEGDVWSVEYFFQAGETTCEL